MKYEKNYWYIEQIFYKDDYCKKLLDKGIIALNFDIDIDLQEAIDTKVNLKDYIDKNCSCNIYMYEFSRIKKDDFVVYRGYIKQKNYIERITYIGKVKDDFNKGYILDIELGHTLPTNWISSEYKKLLQDIYTDELYKIENSEIKAYLNNIELIDDNELLKLLKSNKNNKWHIRNLYSCDLNICIKENEISILPNTIFQLESFKNIKKDDYLFVENIQKIDGKENQSMNTLNAVCKVSEIVCKNEICKIYIEWKSKPIIFHESFSSIIEFNNDEKKCLTIINNELFNNNKNMIFYGVSGTGKTFKSLYKALENINYLQYHDIYENMQTNKDIINKTISKLMKRGNIRFCTFHQSYSYEEFIEGLKPDKNGNFKVEDGIFKELVLDACYEGLRFQKKLELEFKRDELDSDKFKYMKKKLVLENIYDNDSFDFSEAIQYVIIIDEINRGNVSKIFGDMITLLEEDKRLTMKNQVILKLPYSKEDFCIPKNIYIIGTMNTSDKSITVIDSALRRRFCFEEVIVRADLLQAIEGIDLKKLLITINDRIEFLSDRDFILGHAYFINVNDISDIIDIIKNKIIPLLQDIFYNDLEKVGLVLGGIGEDKNDKYIIYKKEIKGSNIFKNINNYEIKTKYYIKYDINYEELKNIYE